MTRRTLAALAALVAVTATALGAHDLFVKMDSYFLAPDMPVSIPVLNGTFQVSLNSITTDRIADISVLSEAGRERIDTAHWVAETDTSYLEIRTGEPGTYVMGVSTLPQEIGLDGADFNEYLAVDGIPDVLVERARDRELDKEARERYSKHVKAVFQVGERRTGALDAPLGYPAELIPLVNPYTLSVGDEMMVRALVDGEPVAGQLVLTGGEGARGMFEEWSGRTARDGVLSFPITASGRWYVKFINMRKSPKDDIDYESKWATLTFEIH